MARIKKFDVLTVPVEVEYTSPILGRVFGLLAWLMLVRVRKFNLEWMDETVCSF